MKVKIIGGLGNQMFQYATAYAIARRTKQELLVDISDAINYKTHPLRITELSCSAKFETISPVFEKYVFSPRIPFCIRQLLFSNIYIEKDLSFDPEIDKKSIDKKIVGYFQCEKYFLEFREEILKEFKPKASFSEYQKEVMNCIKSNHSCSIHIRRGDYVSSQIANDTHGTCDKRYFSQAIDYLKSKEAITSDTVLFIFSDDIEWCKENISYSHKTYFVHGDPVRVELDLWLMSLCDNNIISNSSFSWWGAWLNENENKTVVAPKSWFKKDIKNNIVPDAWVKL
ncbi:alpha-1,2-fucosyltransferase [Citrobacter portucalensis]|uniref:alpha-1,2-fucosyltransferase n=3 Tax=Citrobacter portucalensis TaxID=1639133 RepID=UPI0018A53A26|nr:alpha-1,2-fucosyltransferase [Citrobacter portucalensis]BBV40288.1 alpha-1,2-fucosyltransferase [Citrobacter portucalensis]BBV45269.1 alpha-1,2-fucosyltransferase [Citrobacter portucalensis]BBW11264.1 alpha-1,2-fucosyltransferase [Citrobacter portucalensis]BBW16349.1 alpha-1,2-fucosyltransferase [Citrobacter portucalensis]BBW41609.1 alpha-1,2-fucosyltransferase [Citrobacter portucalensis]